MWLKTAFRKGFPMPELTDLPPSLPVLSSTGEKALREATQYIENYNLGHTDPTRPIAFVEASAVVSIAETLQNISQSLATIAKVVQSGPDGDLESGIYVRDYSDIEQGLDGDGKPLEDVEDDIEGPQGAELKYIETGNGNGFYLTTDAEAALLYSLRNPYEAKDILGLPADENQPLTEPVIEKPSKKKAEKPADEVPPPVEEPTPPPASTALVTDIPSA